MGTNKALAARAYMLSGSFQGETWNFSGAVHDLTRALEIAKETGDTLREARVWNNLGACHLNAGQYADALAMFEKVLSLRQDDPRNEAHSAAEHRAGGLAREGHPEGD